MLRKKGPAPAETRLGDNPYRKASHHRVPRFPQAKGNSAARDPVQPSLALIFPSTPGWSRRPYRRLQFGRCDQLSVAAGALPGGAVLFASSTWPNSRILGVLDPISARHPKFEGKCLAWSGT